MKGSRAISRQQYHDCLASSAQSIQAAEAVFSIIQEKKQSLLLRRQAVTDWMHTNWLEISKVFLSMQSFFVTAVGSNLAMTLLDPGVFLLSQRSNQPLSQVMYDSKTFLSSYHSMWLQVSDYCQAVNLSSSADCPTKTFRILVSDTHKQAMMREFLMSYLFLVPHGLAVLVDSMTLPDKDVCTLSTGVIRNSTNDYYALSSVFTQLPVLSLEACHEGSSDCLNLCSVM